MMEKTTLIAKIIASVTFHRCSKIFLSALIKFQPLKPSASMMCLWGWGQGGAVESSSPSPQLHIDLTEAGSLGDSLLLGRLKATLTPGSPRQASNTQFVTSQILTYQPHNGPITTSPSPLHPP